MTRTYPRWFSRAVFVLMIAAIIIRFFYWGYTHRTWEDALITVLHSENFVRGLGLTHLQPPGEPPLHGFTSPLSVLIPLLGDLVHVGWGLPFLKIVSAFCGAIAVWLGARILQAANVPPGLALIGAAYLAFEHHQILWGMAGMETEVVTVAYLASIYALQRGSQWQKGLSLGLVMLARPDGAMWVAIAFVFELWRIRKSRAWRDLIPVIAGLTLLYAPWLIFTTLYYGSPVPNTIYAKLGYPSVWDQFHHTARLAKPGWMVNRVFTSLFGGLGTAYGGNGTGYMPLRHGRRIAGGVLVFCAIGTIVAIKRRDLQALPIFAFAITYAAYLYFCAPVLFGWYTVPVAGAALLGGLYGLWAVAERLVPAPYTERSAVAVGVIYTAIIISILPITFRSDKYLQMYIETGVRKQLGLYLGRVSLPTDTIASESLGYVGYYSHRVIYDYPGLCSRDVVRFFRDHPESRNLPGIVEGMRPTYAVFRPKEYRDPQGNIIYPWLAQRYDLVQVFKAPEEARTKIFASNTNIDFEFDVLRLKGAPAAAQ